MKEYNAKRVQHFESGYILNVVNFNFNEKDYEFKYSDFECTIGEILENNIVQYLTIYNDINWKKDLFVKATNDEKLAYVCDKIYDYYCRN